MFDSGDWKVQLYALRTLRWVIKLWLVHNHLHQSSPRSIYLSKIPTTMWYGEIVYTITDQIFFLGNSSKFVILFAKWQTEKSVIKLLK